MQNIFELPDDSLVRLSSILAPHGPVPVSRATWFAWRKAGVSPQAVKIGPNTVAYRVGDVRAFVQQSSARQTSAFRCSTNIVR